MALPTAGSDESRPERGDAARNRSRVLSAAADCFAADPAGTTMEQIARAAGVGKGTLYRRYPGRAAIAVALLDEHERALQQRLLDDPPPLGPGAPPHARLAAFYAAMADFLERHGHLARVVESDARRLQGGAHSAWLLHVMTLVEASGVVAEPGALAEQLLAPLSPTLYHHERAVAGRSRDEIVRALRTLAGVLDPGRPGSGQAAVSSSSNEP
jgi:AcrR family transcriptional regulator